MPEVMEDCGSHCNQWGYQSSMTICAAILAPFTITLHLKIIWIALHLPSILLAGHLTVCWSYYLHLSSDINPQSHNSVNSVSLVHTRFQSHAACLASPSFWSVPLLSPDSAHQGLQNGPMTFEHVLHQSGKWSRDWTAVSLTEATSFVFVVLPILTYRWRQSHWFQSVFSMMACFWLSNTVTGAIFRHFEDVC